LEEFSSRPSFVCDFLGVVKIMWFCYLFLGSGKIIHAAKEIRKDYEKNKTQNMK